MKKTKKTKTEKWIVWNKLTTDNSPMAKARRMTAKQRSKMFDDLVGVQPMTYNEGTIFKFVYENNEKE